MIDINDNLYLDFQYIKRIPIVPLMLEVICRTTGMGFAAVARVTEDRWLACSVRDEIKFGLEEGGELKVETTICDEIRDSKKEVVIDHVAESKDFCEHHTPAMYGFQSYISFPIILKNGDFFGTLCAIDPRPAKLNNPETIGTFKLFTELLSFHLESAELMERSHRALQASNRELNYANNENIQYRQISNHNIKEQLRKISVYSEMLVNETASNDVPAAKKIAVKLNSISGELTGMFQHIADFSGLVAEEINFEQVNINAAVDQACMMLDSEIKNAGMQIMNEEMDAVYGDHKQIRELFFHLISYVIMFSKPGSQPAIKIYADNTKTGLTKMMEPFSANTDDYCEIILEISETGIDEYNLKTIFDIFVHLGNNKTSKKYGPGLAYSKKIIHNHGGYINAKSISENVTLLSVILPVKGLVG